jgi:hypothetical protein
LIANPGGRDAWGVNPSFTIAKMMDEDDDEKLSKKVYPAFSRDANSPHEGRDDVFCRNP